MTLEHVEKIISTLQAIFWLIMGFQLTVISIALFFYSKK